MAAAGVGAELLVAMCQRRSMCLTTLAENRNQRVAFDGFLGHGAVSSREMLVTTGPSPGDHEQRAADDKESRRWLAAPEESEDVRGVAAGVTVVADSESDVYDPFARRPAGVDPLVRAAQDRALVTGGRLFATAARWPGCYRATITVPQRAGRKARQARVAVRLGAAAPRRPDSAAPALAAVNRSVEGRGAKPRNPYAPDTLAWFAWIVARLGGWSGHTSRGCKPPGPKTIARGLERLDGIFHGWHLAHPDAEIHSADP